MLWNGFEGTRKAAVQDGLHFKIISFTDMHEWTSTKYVCDLVCVCVQRFECFCLRVRILPLVSSLQHGSYCICAPWLSRETNLPGAHTHTGTHACTHTHSQTGSYLTQQLLMWLPALLCRSSAGGGSWLQTSSSKNSWGEKKKKKVSPRIISSSRI